MRNIICVFLYFIVKNNTFTIKNIFIQKWRLKSTISTPPSTQPSPDENTYEEQIKRSEDIILLSYKKRNKLLGGFDARTIKNNDTKNAIRYAEQETANFMTKFKEYNEKKELLEKLENPKISIMQKLYMLSTTSEIRPVSINIDIDTFEW